MLFFYTTRIRNKFFNNFEVEHRLATEKVYFQVSSSATCFDKEIKCLLAHFITHKRAFALIFALCGKTIRAVKVARVRNVKTQRFYNVAVVFIVVCKIFVNVFRKEFACLFKRFNIFYAL